MFVKILSYPFRIICVVLIYIYKFLISPFLPKTCIYYPSCSTYAFLCIREFGVFKGIYFAIKRLCRCTPKHCGGYDPIPHNIKGDCKWII